VHRGIRAARFTFEPASQALIIKLMPRYAHENTSRTFIEAVTDHIKLIPGHTKKVYAQVGATRFQSLSGRGKEGDQGLQPRTRYPMLFPRLLLKSSTSNQ